MRGDFAVGYSRLQPETRELPGPPAMRAPQGGASFRPGLLVEHPHEQVGRLAGAIQPRCPAILNRSDAR